ncbi:MAG: outer membrane protein assembly factor BamA [Phycisphaerales bacterium]
MNRTPWRQTAVSFGLMLGLALIALLANRAHAQGIDPQHRLIAAIKVQGLKVVTERLVLNNVRSEVGGPYDSDTVAQDIVRLTHLGRFDKVTARVEPQDDGSVVLIFDVSEQAILTDVQVVGNKAINDGEVLGMVLLRPGDPSDPYLIEQGLSRIIQAYQDKGYFVADVSIDREVLDESNILVYRVREGPRVKITGIKFEGNTTYTRKQLKSKLRSKVYFPILQKGDLNREQLELDASSVRDFYNARGFLDAQVGRRIDLSPDEKEATVVFLIEEGRRYRVYQVRVLPPESGEERLLPDAQLRQHLLLAPGDVYSQDKVDQSVQMLQDVFGRLGYLDVKVDVSGLPHEDDALVDLIVQVEQGLPSVVGKVSITGNELTRQKVVLRQVRGMDPGRPFDSTGVDRTRRLLTDGRLFSEGTVTILGEPGDESRDVLIDVTEATTGSISFGAGVSSDAGVLGAIDLSQRNFDITDTPQTPKEFLTGRAFRGAGQSFALSLQPGDQVSRYSISFREPSVLETDYSFATSLSIYEREFDAYDEGRAGGSVTLGRRFGDVWSVTSLRTTSVDISQIEVNAPVDVFATGATAASPASASGVVRNTTDSSLFHTRGNRYEEFNVEASGRSAATSDFARIATEFKQFWTVDEFLRPTHRPVSASARRSSPRTAKRSSKALPRWSQLLPRLRVPRRQATRHPRRHANPRRRRRRQRILTTGVEYNCPIYSRVLRGVFFSGLGHAHRKATPG